VKSVFPVPAMLRTPESHNVLLPHPPIRALVKGRFQAELVETNMARDAYRHEIQHAFTALDEMSEALAESQERMGQIDDALAAALTARDVSEALRAANAHQHDITLTRLREVESELKIDALSSAALGVELERAKLTREAVDRALQESTANLTEARRTIEETTQFLAPLRDANDRQAEVILLRDAEISWLRTVATQQALPDHAGETERLDVATPASPAAGIETIPEGRARRCRSGPRVDQHNGYIDADGPDHPGAAALSSDEQQASTVTAARRPQ
jgi:hypothetical protein